MHSNYDETYINPDHCIQVNLHQEKITPNWPLVMWGDNIYMFVKTAWFWQGVAISVGICQLALLGEREKLLAWTKKCSGSSSCFLWPSICHEFKTQTDHRLITRFSIAVCLINKGSNK